MRIDVVAAVGHLNLSARLLAADLAVRAY